MNNPVKAPQSVLVDTTCSPHSRLRPVPIGSVRLEDDFWQPRREVNRRVTLPSQYRKCEETGRIDNFRRASGKIGGEFKGRYYNDSDVYKWVEAVAYVLAEGRDPVLEQQLATAIQEIADAQQPDGYLNTHFTHEKQDQRWTNLRDLHELYCAGHLIQAAVAHRRCTGSEDLLRVAIRFADLTCDTFGPEGRAGTCGHQEIEMALVELYRQTGTRRYLDQAQRFIEARGQRPPIIGGSPYHQDHQPFRELTEVTGHAVRMVYYCCGAADIVAETGDPEYAAALERLWRNMTERRMYVTGGIGSRYEGEAFGEDYELPNERAYAESCAAIGSIMWNWRMLQLSGEARFADLIETTLYNAVLPSLSLDGERYFYQNPLADGGCHRRQPWFECACCPPNIARLLASLPAYFYSSDEHGIWVHQYATSTAVIPFPSAFPSGNVFTVRQHTRYPWEGEVRLEFEATEPTDWSARTLYLRIPAWLYHSPDIFINGNRWHGRATPGTYLEICRTWRSGDVLVMRLPIDVRSLECHPRVVNNRGRIAIRRGPLLYCAEEADVGTDPRSLTIVGRPKTDAASSSSCGEIVTLRVDARLTEPTMGNQGALRSSSIQPESHASRTEVTLIPYYCWGNRAPSAMAVWLRRSKKQRRKRWCVDEFHHRGEEETAVAGLTVSLPAPRSP